MPRLKLSEVDVTTLTLAEGKSETFYWDLDMPGFGCRVRLLKGSTADVKRGWEAQGRIHGKQRIEPNHDRWSAGTLRACNLHLLRYAEPLHDRPIDTVKRADIAALLHNI